MEETRNKGPLQACFKPIVAVPGSATHTWGGLRITGDPILVADLQHEVLREEVGVGEAAAWPAHDKGISGLRLRCPHHGARRDLGKGTARSHAGRTGAASECLLDVPR